MTFKPHQWVVNAAVLILTLILFSQGLDITYPVYAQESNPNDTCFMCHSNPDMKTTLPSGEVIDLYVDRDRYDESVHGQMGNSCKTCHTDIEGYPHPPISELTYREFSLDMYPRCARCHQDQVNAIQGNVHMVAFSEGNIEAAMCTDCHGNHYVQHPGVPRSSIPQTCRKCHAQIYDLYEESVHGAALIGEGNPDVPSCTDCHGSHEIIGNSNYPMHLNSPTLCASCHNNSDIMTKYGLSAGVYDTYVADFHGTTVSIFQSLAPGQDTNKPVCIDCHGVHDILPPSNPNSTVIKENLLQTCRRCHPDATANFPDSWLSHYKPDARHYPIVFIVSWFYKILIPLVIGGMFIFVITDYIRQRIDTRRRIH